MKFEILGPLRVTGAGPVKVTGQRRRILLVALLAHANACVSHAELVDWLWPRRPPRSAHATLHVYISTLRRALEPEREPWQPGERLVTHSTGYLVRVGPDELDTLRFERLVAAAKPALEAGDAPRARRLADEALALWRGPGLADAAGVEAARGEITRLDELRLTAVTVRIQASLALGRHADVVPELTRLVARHPLHEPFYVLLMIALFRCGRRADALAAYRRARNVLAREVQVAPGPDLRRTEAAILNGELD
jgi:SARP family transcriptional regulator, regulator of embCAB operon